MKWTEQIKYIGIVFAGLILIFLMWYITINLPKDPATEEMIKEALEHAKRRPHPEEMPPRRSRPRQEVAEA